jgi:hypothetical protein
MKQRWQDWLMLIFGAWVFFSPFWMPAYVSRGDAAAWNSYIFGALAFAFAWGALATRQLWEDWINLLIGIWLIIAPFALGFHSRESGASWNQIILGILMGLDAIWVLAEYRTGAHQVTGPR